MGNVATTVPITRMIAPEYGNFCYLVTTVRNSAMRGECQAPVICTAALFMGVEDAISRSFDSVTRL
jgi:hypothetical protein